MTPKLAMPALLAMAAVLSWPAPAPALHDVPCGPFSDTVIDDETGERRCVQLAPEVLEVLQRTRQLQLQQERRTRALAAQQRPPDPESRVRELETQQQQIEIQQRLIADVERAKQVQRSRELNAQTVQPALSLEQTLTRQRILNRVEADDTLRRALLRASELERSQNARAQRLSLPAFELESELRVRRRQLEK